MPQQSLSTYQAFGIRLQSDLPLPELRNDDRGGPPDVFVSLRSAPRPSDGVVLDRRACCVGPGLFWLEVPGTVRLLVTEGREIRVEPAPGAGESDVRAYLLGSAIGALLHQRGWLPLHASAVEVDGRAVAFTAPSGGGKSTMAMHLRQQGYRVLCDDICAIDTRGPVPQLWPGSRNLKLWGASLAVIGRQSDDLEPVTAGTDKYRLPLPDLADFRAHDLRAVFLLDWSETVAASTLSGAESVAALIANTYRGHLAAPMGQTAAHWHRCLKTARAISVLRLERPRALDQLSIAMGKMLAELDARRST